MANKYRMFYSNMIFPLSNTFSCDIYTDLEIRCKVIGLLQTDILGPVDGLVERRWKLCRRAPVERTLVERTLQISINTLQWQLCNLYGTCSSKHKYNHISSVYITEFITACMIGQMKFFKVKTCDHTRVYSDSIKLNLHAA